MTRISLNNPGHQEEKGPEHTLSKQPHTWVVLTHYIQNYKTSFVHIARFI